MARRYKVRAHLYGADGALYASPGAWLDEDDPIAQAAAPCEVRLLNVPDEDEAADQPDEPAISSPDEDAPATSPPDFGDEDPL